MFNSFIKTCQVRVNNYLDHVLPKAKTHPTELHTAMRYSVLSPGAKRIRPVLVYASGQACHCPTEYLDPIAAALELIHCYSLVHDDLPAMDNDDFRRNQLTCHKKYSDATAILVGDALQSLAFKVLCKQPSALSSSAILENIIILAQFSGSRGMAGGQAIDLGAIGKTLNIAELEDMHIHKTGALIRAAVLMPTHFQKKNSEISSTLDHYAKCIGLAFQVQDDILDVESDFQTLGKTPNKDNTNNKPTYPSIIGLGESKIKAKELIDDALNCIKSLDEQADPLRWIAEYIISRKK